jgi:hypothetical protein
VNALGEGRGVRGGEAVPEFYHHSNEHRSNGPLGHGGVSGSRGALRPGPLPVRVDFRP